jgi:hypothetical protein
MPAEQRRPASSSSVLQDKPQSLDLAQSMK